MSLLLRLFAGFIIGLTIGTILSYSMGLYDGYLWEQNETAVADNLMDKAEVSSADDVIVLKYIATCMADTFVHFAVVRECNYSLFTPLEEQVHACIDDKFTVGDKAMVESCIIKVLGSQGKNFKDSI